MHQAGDLVRSVSGAWVTFAPTHCPNGHPLSGGKVLVGHLACVEHRGGHTTWNCRICDQTVYGPVIGSGCSVVNGPAAVRNSFGPSATC